MKDFFKSGTNQIKKIINLIVVGKIKLILALIIILFIIICVGSMYIIMGDEIEKNNKPGNVPTAAGGYASAVTIDTSTGKIDTNISAQELWNELVDNGSNITYYLEGPEELAKLLNVSIVTQFPNTNPNEEIDWNKVLSAESTEMQGIIKFKRNILEGKTVLTDEEVNELEKEYDTYRDEFEIKQKEKFEKWKDIELNTKTIELIKSSENIPTDSQIDEYLEEYSGSEEETEVWGKILKKDEVLKAIRNYNGSYSQDILVNLIEDYVTQDDFPSSEKVLEFEEWVKNKGYDKDSQGSWYRPGEEKTMSYADPETFEKYIKEYVNTGSEEAKQQALTHFTLEKKTDYSKKEVQRTESLNGFLFLGDSNTVILKDREKLGINLTNENESLLNGVIYKAEEGEDASYWLQHFNELPSNSQVNGVSVLLGVNDILNTTSMKELINKLEEKYSGKKIYIQSVFHVGHAYTSIDAATMNNYIDDYNKEIEEFCRYKDNVFYIDITRGLEDSDGYLDSKITSDGLHLSSCNIWLDNLASNILTTDEIDEESTTVEEKNDENTQSLETMAEPNLNSQGYHAPLNPYDAAGLWGQCTWFAWGRFYEIYGYDPGFTGSGKDCVDQLINSHPSDFEKSYDVPKVGAIFSCEGGGRALSYEHGHVGVVIYYDGSKIITDEGNVSGKDWQRITYTIDEFKAAYPNGLVFANPKNSPTISTGDDSDFGTQYYVKIATWKETQTSFTSNDEEASPEIAGPIYEMTTTNINYYDMVKSYTMPFEYLWTFLVVTESKDFVMELADLVYESEIIVTVNDCKTVTTSTKVDTYDKDVKATTNASVRIDYEQNKSNYSDSAQGTKTDKISTNSYKTEQTVITTTNTVEAALTKANVWIVEYTKDYKYQMPEETKSGPISSELEEIDYKVIGTDNEDPLDYTGELLSGLKQKHLTANILSEKIDKVNTTYESNTYNRRETITTTVEKTKYIAGVADVREKVQKVKKEGAKRGEFRYKEKNFVTLLLSDASAQLKIIDGSEWIFEFLSRNSSTAEMVDLTKYLLYKVTGADSWGITEFDFNIFSPDQMQTSSDKNEVGVTNNIIEFINKFEGGNQYRAGEDYIIYMNGIDNCYNLGPGVVVGTTTEGAYYPDLIPNPTPGQIIPKETYEEIYRRKMKQYTNALDTALAKYGVTLEQHQYDALLSFVYNLGPAYADELVASYKNGGDSGLWNYMRKFVYSQGQYLEGLARRRKEEYELFTTGDYTIS